MRVFLDAVSAFRKTPQTSVKTGGNAPSSGWSESFSIRTAMPGPAPTHEESTPPVPSALPTSGTPDGTLVGAGTDPDLLRFLRDRSDAAFEVLYHRYRPMVAATCRARLHDPGVLDDAVQHVFVRLAHRGHTVHGSLRGWLNRVATNLCHDLNRARAARRRAHEGAATHGAEPQRHARFLWHQAAEQLPAALARLDEDDRLLITRKFFGQTPLRVLATELNVSIPTVSRHVSAAVQRLAGHLAELGVGDVRATQAMLQGAAPVTQPDYFFDPGLLVRGPWKDDFTPDAPREQRILPGWTRPLRVGFFISRQTYLRPELSTEQANWQGAVCRDVATPGHDLITIAEADSLDDPVLERTVRAFEITDGLVAIGPDADHDLRHLDVIILGHNFVLRQDVAERVVDATERGTGLMSYHHTGTLGQSADPRLIERIKLAESHICNYCGVRAGIIHDHIDGVLPGHVRERHPAAPGLVPGQAMSLWPCGSLYRVKRDARVIVATDAELTGNGHFDTPDPLPLSPMPMPVMVSGSIGRGRVLAFSTSRIEHWHERHPFIGPTFKEDLIAWLAEPRRDEPY